MDQPSAIYIHCALIPILLWSGFAHQ